MKKFLIFSLLLILGACFLTPQPETGGDNGIIGDDVSGDSGTGGNNGSGDDNGTGGIPGGTGDLKEDAAIIDSLEQLGSVKDHDIWHSKETTDYGGYSMTRIINWYFTETQFKGIYIERIDGLYCGVEFNDEIGRKEALEGSLLTTEDFMVLTNSVDITDKKGYDALYIMESTKFMGWYSEKFASFEPVETETWFNQGSASRFFLTKESPTELRFIHVTRIGSDYIIQGDFDVAVEGASVFIKK